jgi:uncharacterized membrane protein
MIQPYMGALKSQVLIPVFAAFGASAPSLRLATIALGLVGLLVSMAWTREIFGTRVAIVAGALLALDPSYLWISRHDWGSIALALICRCGGLYFLTVGWRRRSAARLFAGGLFLGLGVYNKIDFGVFVAGAALALLIALPRIVAEVVRTRGLRPLPAVLGLLLGAGPMVAAAGTVLAATHSLARRQAEVSGDWTEKFNTFVAMLDGSYFHKLMLAGGSFERMFEVTDAATGAFLEVFLGCGVYLGVCLWRDRRRGELDPGQAFVWLATIAIAAGLFLLPRGVRIHHTLNLYPFPQVVVAVALVRLHSAGRGGALARRLAAAALLLAVLAGSLAVNVRTLATIRESGGKGRWSDALAGFGAELAEQPGAVVVSLDWGFHGPLRFAARDLPGVEPIWTLRGVGRARRAWSFNGTPQHVYVFFDEDLAVFDFGRKFRAMLGGVPPESVNVRRHLDREGDLAFLSARFARPHRLTYAGEFEVELQ